MCITYTQRKEKQNNSSNNTKIQPEFSMNISQATYRDNIRLQMTLGSYEHISLVQVNHLDLVQHP